MMTHLSLDGYVVLDESGMVIARADTTRHATEIMHALNAIESARTQHDFEYGLIDPCDWDRFTAQDIIAVGDGITTFGNIAWGRGAYAGSPADSDDRVRREREAEEKDRSRLLAWNMNAVK